MIQGYQEDSASLAGVRARRPGPDCGAPPQEVGAVTQLAGGSAAEWCAGWTA